MVPFRSDIFPLIVLVLCPLLFPVTAAAGQVLPFVSAPSQQEDEYNEDWHSHIDNQAYLERRKRLKQDLQTRKPVIIIDRREMMRDSARRNCYYDDCGSWEMEYEYHTPDSSFIYREGYRPNRPDPVIIRTDPHHHHHKRYLPDHRGYSPRSQNDR